MKYNEKYDLYIDDDYVIYYWNKRLDKLMQRRIFKHKSGYLVVHTKGKTKRVHRVIYETFIGEIPDGYEIDHIKGNKTDNRPERLKCVSHKENINNPITKQKLIGNKNAKGRIGKTYSEFGVKFKEHFGITKNQNPKLYDKECAWFNYHGKCRWEA